MLQLTCLIDTKHVSIHYLSGTDPTTIVFTCTGVGHAMGGIDVQKPEFVKTAFRSGTVVTITDKTRSWGNHLDFGLILESVDFLLTQASYSVTIGNSMGGFNAILLAKKLQADACIAFAPQFSVHPDIVPQENRWMIYRNEIKNYVYKSLKNHFLDKTNYLLINGGSYSEYIHWSKFPRSINIQNYVLPQASHDVAAWLKHHGLLHVVIESYLQQPLRYMDVFQTKNLNAFNYSRQPIPIKYKAKYTKDYLKYLLKRSI